jgi:hypothetical protein
MRVYDPRGRADAGKLWLLHRRRWLRPVSCEHMLVSCTISHSAEYARVASAGQEPEWDPPLRGQGGEVAMADSLRGCRVWGRLAVWMLSEAAE